MLREVEGFVEALVALLLWPLVFGIIFAAVRVGLAQLVFMGSMTAERAANIEGTEVKCITIALLIVVPLTVYLMLGCIRRHREKRKHNE